jgi:hypothetical protein
MFRDLGFITYLNEIPIIWLGNLNANFSILSKKQLREKDYS